MTMNMFKTLATVVVGLWAGVATANTDSKDLLIKFANTAALKSFTSLAHSGGARIETLGESQWVRVQLTEKQDLSLSEIAADPNVLAVQPNYKIRLLENYQAKTPAALAKLGRALMAPPIPMPGGEMPADNPPFPSNKIGGSGADSELSKQWGMNDIGVQAGWKHGKGAGVIVAVIDTGVDYTHEDLQDNLWRNAGEMGKDAQGRDKSANGVDDDGNGYVDDLMGWDMVTNDNKPFDLAMGPLDLLMKGGNPGHGTHCAGNVAAVGNNGRGVAGVAPDAKIMILRFLSEKGEGDTAGAIKAIDYAVKNGARVLSNSWGSEGEDPAEGEANKALREAIQRAEDAGTLFVAAAGNGHQGVGYDNDTDAKPAYPASYDHDTIISVAAIDVDDKFGSFSNWGRRTVDIAAPGVKVFSTTVGGKYSDMVIDLFGIQASWDGTSMACPHVAGAAAAYWSKHPTATWKDVKKAILDSAAPIAVAKGKLVTEGKLNFEALMQK
ncbi:MAG: S8 family peptidase [Bdellovibrionota bacterium]